MGAGAGRETLLGLFGGDHFHVWYLGAISGVNRSFQMYLPHVRQTDR